MISEEASESASGWCMPLALMLMVEQSLGSESAHAPYVSALPDRSYVPMMWSPDERQLLIGTEVQEVCGIQLERGSLCMFASLSHQNSVCQWRCFASRYNSMKQPST